MPRLLRHCAERNPVAQSGQAKDLRPLSAGSGSPERGVACRVAASWPATASAASTRRSRSAAARWRAAACRRLRPPGSASSSARSRATSAAASARQRLERDLAAEERRGGAGRRPHPACRPAPPARARRGRTEHRRDGCDQQTLQHGAMRNAEVGQGRVVDADPAAQPFEAGAVVARHSQCQFARAAYALHRGVEPERRQKARVGRRMTRTALGGLRDTPYPALSRSSRLRRTPKRSAPGNQGAAGPPG